MVIEVKKNVGQTTPALLLAERGFRIEYVYPVSGGEEMVFVKDGEKYKFTSWEHENGYVERIMLRKYIKKLK